MIHERRSTTRDESAAGSRSVDGRLVVWVFVAVLVVAPVIWFILGMPGMDHSGTGGMSDMPGMGRDDSNTALVDLDASQFEQHLTSSATVINVHVPYDGQIEGTDAFVPFDRILQDPAIPRDKDSLILLYCRTGRMSQVAGAVLVAAGYRNVAHLRGGMDAWEASGRTLGMSSP